MMLGLHWSLAVKASVHRVPFRFPSPGYLAYALTPLLITNLLVPEFLARWRGAGLLYPTKSQIILERFVWTSILVVVCLVLSLTFALI